MGARRFTAGDVWGLAQRGAEVGENPHVTFRRAAGPALNLPETANPAGERAGRGRARRVLQGTGIEGHGPGTPVAASGRGAGNRAPGGDAI
jgi:hypothetical protein